MLKFLFSVATTRANLGLSANDFEIMINSAKTGSSKTFMKSYDRLYVKNYEHLEAKLLKRSAALTKAQAQDAVENAFVDFKKACFSNHPPVFGNLTEEILLKAMCMTGGK
jgi:hypothetical protein